VDKKVALKRLYFKCQRIGAAYSQEIGEDFPGWAVTQVRLADKFIPIRWLLARYLCEKFGYLNSKYNLNRMHLGGLKDNWNADPPSQDTEKSLEEPATWDDRRASSYLFEKIKDPPINIEAKLDHDSLMDLLPRNERAFRVLTDKWGMSTSEIAYVFGVTINSVNHWKRDGERILKAVHKHASV